MSGSPPPAPNPGGRVLVMGETPDLPTLKWATGTLLGFYHFLTQQLPPSAREFMIYSSDKVPQWDLDVVQKTVTVAQRVGLKVTDAMSIAKKAGFAGTDPPFGIPVDRAVRLCEESVKAIAVALDKLEPGTSGQEPGQRVLGETSPSVAPSASESGMSRTAKVVIMVAVGVVVLGTIGAGVWFLTRGAPRSRL